MYRLSPFIRHVALALLAGAGLASLWLNLSPGSYYDFIEWHLIEFSLPQWAWANPVTVTPFLIVTDILMALFVFLLGKELWEALILERGALSGRRAILPLAMVAGGLLGAALGWLWLSSWLETAEEALPGGGWTVPLGTDSALVGFFGLMMFRRRPALHLLLLLAILTDLAALLILGISKLSPSPRLLWLLLPVAMSIGIYLRFGRQLPSRASERERRAAQVIWPYILAGTISWFGTAAAGMPAALGLLPLIPAIAHGDRSFGLFAEAEVLLHDPLNRLAQRMMLPVIAVLFLFGLIRGGVDLAAFNPTTLVTLGSLWLFRPLGMLCALLVLALIFGRKLPRGLRWHDLPLICGLLSLGFTTPLIAIEADLPGGAMREAARMGLALSLLIGPITLLIAWGLRRFLHQARGR